MGGLLGAATAGGSAGFAAKRFAMARSSPVVPGLAGSAEATGTSTGAGDVKEAGALAVKAEALNNGAGSAGGAIAPKGEAWGEAAAANGEGDGAGEAAPKGEAGVGFEAAAANGEAAGAGEAAAKGEAGAMLA